MSVRPLLSPQVSSYNTSQQPLILAFHRSFSLTLIILASLPLLTFLQSLSQLLAHPLLAQERRHTSRAASTIDRAVSAILTVKAFNTQGVEVKRAKKAFIDLEEAEKRLNHLWGCTSGFSQFVMMAMFVQAFWFGAKLVREHKVSPGDVMAVFWACLIATSNLQMRIPRWITLAKGRFALKELIGLVDGDDDGDKDCKEMNKSHALEYGPSLQQQQQPSASMSMSHKRSHRALRKITPQRCQGDMALHNVTFSYPSRSSSSSGSTDIQQEQPLNLSSISLFLHAHEMTFIVGSSGSGKSTVAQLLLGLYEPQRREGGQVTLDEQDIRYLESEWVRENVMGLGQAVGGGGVILEGASIFENVAVAAAEGAGEVTREQVEEACQAALLHEFIQDLPKGYDTVLGDGVQLSGGQKQRLGIARARLRNPPVLVLGEWDYGDFGFHLLTRVLRRSDLLA